MEGEGKVIDLNQTSAVLASEANIKGGLSVPNKDRPIFRPTERKSNLDSDVLANEKRQAKGGAGFKVPAEKTVLTISSIDEDEKSSVDEFGGGSSQGARSHAPRRYRGNNAEEKSHSESTTTCGDKGGYTPHTLYESPRREVSTPGSSWSDQSHISGNHDRRERQRYDSDRSDYRRRDDYRRTTNEKYSFDYGRKKTKYEHISSRSSGRSDWDDGRWEWEDTPRREDRDTHSVSRRHQHSSQSPMLVGASPDACLVSPWLDGHTPRTAASPWDHISLSPVPIWASGSSKRASDSRQVGRSHQLTFSVTSSSEENGTGTGTGTLFREHDYEITDEMRQEMDYNADRAWYLRGCLLTRKIPEMGNEKLNFSFPSFVFALEIGNGKTPFPFPFSLLHLSFTLSFSHFHTATVKFVVM